MKPFLKQVARHYYLKRDVENRCFVFPNRRSMVFFTKYLSEEVLCDPHAKPFVAPRMLTINDLFLHLSGKSQADRVAQLLDLYDCYKELNSRAESLDEFVFWGDILLADFNDVDKYYVDPKQLFTNVSDFKSIQDTFEYLTPTQREAIERFVGHFRADKARVTVNVDSNSPDVKKKFLLIWNILYKLYVSFNERLSSKGLAYEGMVYRGVAEKVIKGGIPVEEDVNYVFVGLNALNECEKILLKHLRDSSRAEFCWDFSGKLISDPQNRSSYFLTENIKEFPQAADWDSDGLKIPQVNVVSVPSSIGQTKRIPDILKQLCVDNDKSDFSQTAVILPDEGLLVPVLNSIPEFIQDINVTMGLPMKGSLLYSMMSDIASIQLHAVNRKGQSLFYHKQVWNLFSNELFRNSLDSSSQEVIRKVRQSAKYYIPQSELNGTEILDVVFRQVVKDLKTPSEQVVRDFGEYQKNVIRTIAPRVSEDVKLVLELEYAKEYYRCVNVLMKKSLNVLPMTYVKLLSGLLSSVSVPFKGEPLRGLQIMGPLEMRALDFRNLIILSANEGTFPRRNVNSSFVPPELRKGFGLPTYEYQDAVWAYYFYRAISRAENVWLLVDSRTEGIKSGEESRYIKQLEYHFGVPVNRYIVGIDNMSTESVDEIQKTEDDVRAIRNAYLSATAIQNYLSCPARFYYEKVKKLAQEKEVAESLDHGMFGTVFHEVMRAVYTSEEAMKPDFFFPDDNKPVPGQLKLISRAYIRDWLGRRKEIKSKINALIMNQLQSFEVTGRNLVIADVILKYVIKTLQRDVEQLEENGVDCFEILGREMLVSGELDGHKLVGYIDRVDSFAPGMLRIVDYKTGKVLKDDEDICDETADAVVEKIFTPDISQRPKIAFQFYMYDRLLQNYDIAKNRSVYNCVYTTSNIFKECPKTIPMNKKFYDNVTVRLRELLSQMCDTSVPFRRTKDESICAYCDFKNICGR